MSSKEEQDRMDRELMDIVNSGSRQGRRVINTGQIKQIIDNQNKYTTIDDSVVPSKNNVSLQKKSIVGRVSEKKKGTAKIIIIAGITIAVLSSISLIIIGSNVSGDDFTQSGVVSISDVSDISAVDDSLLGHINNTSDGEDVVIETSEIEEDIQISENSVNKGLKSNNDLSNDISELDSESNSVEDLDESDNNVESNIIEDSVSDESFISNDKEVVFDVGTSSDIDKTQSFLDDTIEGYLIKFYSKMYGVDSNIVAAICYQESGGVNIVDGGAATGIMMLENMGDYDIAVYNYNDNCWETLTVSSSNTDDVEYNIRCGIANIQNKLNYFNGNIYAALQAYNYSEYTLENALDANGYQLNGVNDYGWLYITEDVTNNPQKYGISALDENGDEIYTKYGVSYYPKYTGYHLVDNIVNYNYIDNNIIYNVQMDYATASIINVNEIGYVHEKTL